MFCKLFEVLDKIELTRKAQTGEIITSPGATNGTFGFRQPGQLLCHRVCTRTTVLCPHPMFLLTATAMFIAIKGRARSGYTAQILKTTVFVISTEILGFLFPFWLFPDLVLLLGRVLCPLLMPPVPLPCIGLFVRVIASLGLHRQGNVA